MGDPVPREQTRRGYACEKKPTKNSEVADPDKSNDIGLTEVQMDALKMRLGWWLLVRLGSSLAALVAVAGGALVLIFNDIAENTAEAGVTRSLVRDLRENDDFLEIVFDIDLVLKIKVFRLKTICQLFNFVNRRA